EDPALLELHVPPEFTAHARISYAVTHRPLVGGNHIDILHNGEQAYPAMLQAIDNARQFVYLTTYIFEVNRSGRLFVEALVRAVERGVQVRVLLDGVGDLYWFPRASKALRRRGVPVARFLPPRLIPPAVHFNLRNHRKILVVDGTVAFTGGMNIGDRHLAGDAANAARVVDVQFRFTGPVAAQIEQVFVEDWRFVTGEQLVPRPPPPANNSRAICRTIVEGPDEDMDKLPMILVGAVSAARERVWIMTPYFLPPRELIAALQAAALRGVEVNIILPAVSNLRFVHWATCNMLDELVNTGVRVYYQPPPFVHTKLFVVDDHYAQIGSANLDARSLRLNFELVTEIYDEIFAVELAQHFERVRADSERLSRAALGKRRLPRRIRDALAWLFSPYL
ncbi:MAG: phospholipase D-like domain-containing protein, partial [Gammaproteobacteria bacterium]